MAYRPDCWLVVAELVDGDNPEPTRAELVGVFGAEIQTEHVLKALRTDKGILRVGVFGWCLVSGLRVLLEEKRAPHDFQELEAFLPKWASLRAELMSGVAAWCDHLTNFHLGPLGVSAHELVDLDALRREGVPIILDQMVRT